MFFLSFCTTPPCRMILSVLFLSVAAVRCLEVNKELRSTLIDIFNKAAAEAFCILVLRVSIPCGAAQCLFIVFFFVLLLLFLCLFVNLFSNLCAGAFFLVQEKLLWTRQMAWAISTTQYVELFWISVFGTLAP